MSLCHQFQEINNILDKHLSSIAKEGVHINKIYGYADINADLFQKSEKVVSVNVLSTIIRTLTGQDNGPRVATLDRIYNSVMKNGNSTTRAFQAGGVLIECMKGSKRYGDSSYVIRISPQSTKDDILLLDNKNHYDNIRWKGLYNLQGLTSRYSNTTECNHLMIRPLGPDKMAVLYKNFPTLKNYLSEKGVSVNIASHWPVICQVDASFSSSQWRKLSNLRDILCIPHLIPYFKTVQPSTPQVSNALHQITQLSCHLSWDPVYDIPDHWEEFKLH